MLTSIRVVSWSKTYSSHQKKFQNNSYPCTNQKPWRGFRKTHWNPTLSPVFFFHHIPQVSSVCLFNSSPSPTFPGPPGRTILSSQYCLCSKHFIMYIDLEFSLNPFPLPLMYSCSFSSWFFIIKGWKSICQTQEEEVGVVKIWENKSQSLIEEKVVNIYTLIIFTPSHHDMEV